ncbi:MAG: nitroreductase [Lachnospiraceae bacterium]|jgi:nitroreductase|nr:nitroreductase [Lachnospiraceae bacterium]
MKLLEVMQKRRSVRTYTGEAVSEEDVTCILQAGLLSASGKAIRPWEFIVVRNKETLKSMSRCRAAGSQMLEAADCAVVVLGDEEKSDVWVEDCSVAMANMHLMADSLGVGSCWIQGRLREAPGGRTTEAYLRELLEFPENYRLEAILSLGMPQNHPGAYELGDLLEGKVHRERF